MKAIFTLIITIFLSYFNCNAQNYIKADDSNIQYFGRIDFGDPQEPTFTFPGVSIKAKFKGTYVSFVMNDQSIGGDTKTNYYNVIIDGVVDTVMAVNSTDTIYEVSTCLTDREHVIEVFKRTEGSVGKSGFLGFIIPEVSLLALDPKSSKKVEFIGDSRTCGYGNEMAEYNTALLNTGFHSVNEDNYDAWGSITTRRLGSQYHCTAISGRGLFRNNTSSTVNVVPQQFLRTFQDVGTDTWNPSNYIPDVVVIHLGTNDFFPETWATPDMLDSASYVNAYIDFVTLIRQHYPISSTKLILAYGNSKTDWWPAGFMTLTRWTEMVNAVADSLTSAGDTEIYPFLLPGSIAPYGEDWHPSKAGHFDLSDKITEKIISITGWSTGVKDCAGVEGGTAFLDGCNRCVGGTTNLTAMDVNECAATASTCTVAGINGDMVNKQLKVYPNPVKDILYIDHYDDKAAYLLFDVFGVLVTAIDEDKVDMSNYPIGVYLLKSTQNDKVNVLKVIKE